MLLAIRHTYSVTRGAKLNYAYCLFGVALTLLNVGEKQTLTIGGIKLGKVKTEQIKHLGKELMARFPGKFNTNFDDNKKQVDALTKGPTTRVRNKVAGYITRTISLAQANNAIDSDLEEQEIAE